jgi:hypothetical protein
LKIYHLATLFGAWTILFIPGFLKTVDKYRNFFSSGDCSTCADYENLVRNDS